MVIFEQTGFGALYHSYFIFYLITNLYRNHLALSLVAKGISSQIAYSKSTTFDKLKKNTIVRNNTMYNGDLYLCI